MAVTGCCDVLSVSVFSPSEPRSPGWSPLHRPASRSSADGSLSDNGRRSVPLTDGSHGSHGFLMGHTRSQTGHTGSLTGHNGSERGHRRVTNESHGSQPGQVGL